MPVQSMLPPENSVPGLPRTGGYAPSPDEALRDFHRQRQWAEMARYARLHDPTVNMLTALAANYVAKGDTKQAQHLMATDSMKIVRELSSIGSSWGLFGGNPVNMMAGISQFAGSSQFRVGSNMFGGTAQMFGGGIISDMFSRQLFDQVKNQFLSKNTGLPDRMKTYGFNKDEIGQVFSLMGSRRMFSGMNIGDMNWDAASKQYKFKADERVTARITQTLQETTKLLANVRDIVGSREIPELVRVAEQVSGISLRGSSSPAALNTRLERLRTTAGIMGVDKEAFLTSHMATTAMAAPIYGRGLASSMSMAAWDRAATASLDRNASVAQARMRGDYRYAWDEQELAQIGMKDQIQALAENPLLAEALFIQQNVNNGNSRGRDALAAAVKGYSNAGSSQDRVAATKQIAAAIKGYTGAEAGTLWREMGPGAILRGLSPESNDVLAGTLSNYAQNMNRNVLRRYLAKGVVGSEGMNTDMATSAAFFFKRGLDADQQQAVIDALGSGNMNAVRDIVNANASDIAAAGLNGDMQNFLSAAGKNRNFGRFLTNLNNVTQGDSQLANMESVGARRRANEKAISDWYWSNMVGGDRIAPEGMMMDFARSLVSGTARIDNGMISKYMSGRTGAGESVQTYHGKMDANTARELRKVLGTYEAGGLERALGLDANASDAAIAGALGSSGGQKAYMEFMRRSGAVFSMDTRGAFILSKGAAEKGRQGLELGQRVYERAVLTGANMNDDKVLKDLEQQIIGEDAAMRGMKNNPVAAGEAISRRAQLLNNFLGDDANVMKALDPDSNEFTALGQLSKTDAAGFRQAIGNVRKKYQSGEWGKDEAARKQAVENLRALEDKLGGSQKQVQPVMIVDSSIAALRQAMGPPQLRTQ